MSLPSNEDIIDLIHQTILRRFALGVFRGRVEYNQDPLGLGRIKVRVPYFHGEYNQLPLDKLRWAWPAFPIKSHEVPEVGDYVWVIFEHGDPDYPVYFGQWYPIHLEDYLYGYAKGRRDVDNKEDEWYPTEDRVYSSEKGYHLKGPTVPPEAAQAIDQDAGRERVILRSPKGADFYVSDQDDFELVEILDRAGQGLRMTSPNRDPKPGDSSRFLESSFEKPRFDEGRGKSKLELHGHLRTKISLEKTPEGEVVRIGYGPIDIVINEKNNSIYLDAYGSILLIDTESRSIHLVTDKLSVSCRNFDVSAQKVSISGDVEVSGDLRITGLVIGVDKDQPDPQR